jgi:hypothetical protein
MNKVQSTIRSIELIRLIKIYLNEYYSKVHIRKYFSDALLMQNGLKQGYALSPLFNLV